MTFDDHIGVDLLEATDQLSSVLVAADFRNSHKDAPGHGPVVQLDRRDVSSVGLLAAIDTHLPFHMHCITMSYTMSTLTIRISEPLRRELEKLCRQKQQPMSDLVRDSLQRYIAAQRFAALRSKTLPFAEAQGFLADDDVFKAIS
ncbi:MAG TPA: ribbon-helix-helix protein, CopG family [Tepidisphaeraceae bacterium]|nr:ribbon-helix-helix protein, CopG family [Tepidisphaeraceae bacterium]